MAVFLYLITVGNIDHSVAKMKSAILKDKGMYDLVASSIFCYHILSKEVYSSFTSKKVDCLG